LATWLYQLRMPERLFWKTMTPRRLLATLARPDSELEEPQEPLSLAEYLSGGK
jgi:hypothetical protein